MTKYSYGISLQNATFGLDHLLHYGRSAENMYPWHRNHLGLLTYPDPSPSLRAWSAVGLLAWKLLLMGLRNAQQLPLCKWERKFYITAMSESV